MQLWRKTNRKSLLWHRFEIGGGWYSVFFTGRATLPCACFAVHKRNPIVHPPVHQFDRIVLLLEDLHVQAMGEIVHETMVEALLADTQAAGNAV